MNQANSFGARFPTKYLRSAGSLHGRLNRSALSRVRRVRKYGGGARTGLHVSFFFFLSTSVQLGKPDICFFFKTINTIKQTKREKLMIKMFGR